MGIINKSQSIIDDIGAQATAMQDTASDPTNNVWVGASAGTGKTKVLTDRILRLLLPPQGGNAVGVHPSRILGITFTKAGANEMIARVTEILSKWAVCKEKTLKENLDILLGYNHSLNQYKSARQLFASITDMPNGLNITTIHAFCQSLLGRFPLEAKLSPQFKLIDDSESRALIQMARNTLIIDIEQGREDKDTIAAFQKLATWKNGESINKLISKILNDQEKLNTLLEQHKTVDGVVDAIHTALNINKEDTQENTIRAFFNTPNYPTSKAQDIIEALSHGSALNIEKSNEISLFTKQTADEKITLYDTYKSLFLTSEGTIQKRGGPTKNAVKFNPNAKSLFTEEAERIQYCENRLRSIALAESTIDILKISFKIINKYNDLKLLNNSLDYNDLILKSRDLLCSRSNSGRAITDWVLYKIDGGIDHILVDEAQDTNPIQWQIIEKIAEEFFDGESAREHNPHRSVFVVGDEKQSIFRFQGAQPAIFDTVKNRLKSRIESAQKPWCEMPMGTSFRSVGAILQLTDAVFNNDIHHKAVSQNNTQPIKHKAYRYGQAGHVELWPPYKAPKSPDRPPWALPITIMDGFNAKKALAKRIAATIRAWTDPVNGEQLKAKGRIMRAGDIMILVRSRNSLVEHLITALKSEEVAVSGIDRMVVSDQIAVQDIMAALSFAMMPDDDLNLATLLKSPFIGFDDSDIENHAHSRGNASLWSIIKNDTDTIITQWLSWLIETISTQSVSDAITNILVGTTPFNKKTGWQAITARLGLEAIDAIEELLSMAQNYDLNHPHLSIQGFLHFIESDKRDLKRELESGGDMVRIMTVHASKGLQSPIVIMPDTTTLPKSSGNSDDGFLWDDNGLPLWIKDPQDINDTYKSQQTKIRNEDLCEYDRLLYVAMTRAEDRLIVCGHLNGAQKTPNEQSWYKTIKIGLETLSPDKTQLKTWPHDEIYMMDDAPETLVFETDQIVPQTDKIQQRHLARRAATLPKWASQHMPTEQQPPKTMMPSRMDDSDIPVRSPLTSRDDTHRFKRGLLTHSLLQYLPDIEPKDRNAAAIQYIEKQATGIDNAIQKSITTECMTILNTPKFAPFFAQNSLSEIPITGTITNPDTGKIDIISGEIDRMVVTDDTVWIIDYKSNRPPSKDVKNIPKQYIKQLNAYKTLISKIYPNHRIRTALLWTDGPHMMEVET